MRRLKIYLDTSTISFYFAEDTSEKMEITRKFFDNELASGKYEVFISLLVLDEIEKTHDQILREKLLLLTHKYVTQVFALNDEIDLIATRIVEEGIIPAKYKDDALHLAFTLVNNVDYIVSWNFKHIVKIKTKRSIKSFAVSSGYKEIEIISPMEMIEDEDG